MEKDKFKEAEGFGDQSRSIEHEGLELILKLYRLIKGAGLYERNNTLIERLTLDCLEVLTPILQEEGQIFLKLIQNDIFLNNRRIPVKADCYAIFKSFNQVISQKKIGTIEFLGEISKDHLQEFIFLLEGLDEDNEDNHLYLNHQLAQRGLSEVRVDKIAFFKDGYVFEAAKDHREFAKEIYFKSLNLVKEVVDGIRSQKVINIRKAKHLMQGAVNSIMEDESALLALASIKNYDEYTFNHSVNVAIYAMALGQRIGIPKKDLCHLGIAGLFHDIGKIKIPLEILNKKEKLSAEDWAIIRAHPVMGTEIIIQMKEWGELSTRLISATFEHHLKYDLSGYPKLSRKRNLTLFGKIIALADFYDALVRPRVYRKFPYVSEKILGFMLERAGKDFSPALVKVFINMIGIYPLGTLVLLNTNEMGIVWQTQEDPEFIDRPRVCLLYYSDGEYRRGKEVDLREADPETGEFKRWIVKTLDPNEYNINVAEFLI